MRLAYSLLPAFICLACTTSDERPRADTVRADSAPVDPPAAGGSRAETFRAVGQEPGWLLTVDDSLRLQWDYDANRVVVATPRESESGGVRRLEFTRGDTMFSVEIRSTPCADAMSGHQYPATVTVRIAERVLSGCGGDVGLLARDVEWHVDSLDGKPLVPASGITIQLAGDGSVTGSAGCNRYRGTYRLLGNALTISDAVSTRMACSPEIDRQEMRFLEIIGKPLRLHVESNALHLMQDNTDVIIARRR